MSFENIHDALIFTEQGDPDYISIVRKLTSLEHTYPSDSREGNIIKYYKGLYLLLIEDKNAAQSIFEAISDYDDYANSDLRWYSRAIVAFASLDGIDNNAVERIEWLTKKFVNLLSKIEFSVNEIMRNKYGKNQQELLHQIDIMSKSLCSILDKHNNIITLYEVLWKLNLIKITFSQNLFNQIRITDKVRVQEIFKKLFFKDYDSLEMQLKIEDIVLLSNSKPFSLENTSSPSQKSILLSLLSKIDNERSLLVISFDPNDESPFKHTLQGDIDWEENIDNTLKKDYDKNLDRNYDIIMLNSTLSNSIKKVLIPHVIRSSVIAPSDFVSTTFGIDKNEIELKWNNILNIYSDAVFYFLPFESIASASEIRNVDTSRKITYIVNSEKRLNRPSNLRIAVFTNIPFYPDGFEDLPSELPNIISGTKELTSIQEIKKYEGYEANIFNIKEAVNNGFNILHFDCHGMEKNDDEDKKLGNSLFSCLRIADLENKEFPYYFSFSDIAELDLKNVDLVFLSTCHSGSSIRKRGFVNSSIANAFLNSGAKCVIATRDKADSDQVHASFIEAFYSYLGQTDVSNALRLARIEMNNRYKKHHSLSNLSNWICLT